MLVQVTKAALSGKPYALKMFAFVLYFSQLYVNEKTAQNKNSVNIWQITLDAPPFPSLA